MSVHGQALLHPRRRTTRSSLWEMKATWDQIITPALIKSSSELSPIKGKQQQPKQCVLRQNLKTCVPVHQNHTINSNYTGKTAFQIFLQQDSYCPVVKPHSGKISVLGIEAHERKNLLPRNWCLKVPWAAPGRGYLHPTARHGDAEMLQPDCPLVASRTTGAGTPILLCHWLAEGLQVSLGPLPCIIWLPTCKTGRETNRAPCYGAHCYLWQIFRVQWAQKQLRAIHFWSH